MLRASSLSSVKIIERLNRDFINTWIIIPQFEDPQQFFKSKSAIQFAEEIAKEFTYPVDSIILSSDGKTLSQIEFAKLHFGGVDAYQKMLDAAKGASDR